MEIKLTTLRGETADMFYQLGLKEAQSFLKLEEKANKLISSPPPPSIDTVIGLQVWKW
jgi:hypothetical protein